MKKIIKFIAGVALACCMLLPLAACSNTNDNSAEIDDLKQQIEELKNNITGCPKFEYEIGETIPYYISGTKIFEFKVTSFTYQNSNSIDYSVDFIPTFTSDSTATIFTAVLYDTVTKKTFNSNSAGSNSLYFNAGTNNSNKKTIILYYLNYPFASITATPTYWSVSNI